MLNIGINAWSSLFLNLQIFNRSVLRISRSIQVLVSFVSRFTYPMYPGSPILCIQVLLSYASRFSYPLYPGSPILCIQVLLSYVSRVSYHLYPGSPILCIRVLLSYVSRFSNPMYPGSSILCIQVLLSYVSRFSYPLYPGSPFLCIQVHLCYVSMFSYWMYICVFDVSRPQIKDNSLPCHDPWYTDNLEILNSRTILKYKNDLYPTPLNRLTHSPFVKKSYRKDFNRFNQFQGCKARKVISEVFTSLVLQCTVSGRWCKHIDGCLCQSLTSDPYFA